ncbi:type II toxin-antitoxin system VapC family toxin [Jiella pacifica]|uniref:type II toxin-antitoxin system VapC family toxin n=1 Tax=Jiella pacifica TaxID=2696469 RepID=UPI0013D66A25|nr:type II toxin-antitoxin system VapC family toxin [Jiella pacifica]
MKIVADTNVIIRSLVGDDPGQAKSASDLLRRATSIAIALPTFCEIAWTLSRRYKATSDELKAAIISLRSDPKVVCDRDAVDAGLAMIDRGGDFADGVIAFEGRNLGGEVFATFDRKAASLLAAQGYAVDLLAAAP